MTKILRKSKENHKAQFAKLPDCFCWPKLILRYHYIQNVEDGIRIQEYKINK